MTKYSKPPLPFRGNKRNWLKIITEIVAKYPDDFTFVDLFGGSGLVAHNIKQIKPNSRVIYNDYENFIGNRLSRIEQTNTILSEIRAYLTKENVKDDKKLTQEQKSKVQDILTYFKDKYNGLDDYTMRGSLLFSGLNADLFGISAYWNSVAKNNYNKDGYLNGVEVVSQDWQSLMNSLKKWGGGGFAYRRRPSLFKY